MWPAIGAAGRVSADSSSQHATGLANTWLKHCLTNHIACQSKVRGKLPTRVLDVGRESRDLFLHETTKADLAYRYAALTYCWGTGSSESGPMRTQKSNYAERKSRIAFDLLPRTIQDAVRITISLSINFLWVDALCIVQDAPDDWARESSSMSSIFAQSTVTIAADGAAHCHEGCFVAGAHRNRTIMRIPCRGPQRKDVKDRVVGYGDDSFIYVRKPGIENESNGSHTLQISTRPTIDTRAWTMQERLLAPRILHYTADELVWECEEESRCECKVAVKDATILNLSPFKQNYKRFWAEVDGKRERAYYDESRRPWAQSVFVNSTDPRPQLNWRSVLAEYTQRNLTFDTDRLAAISGLASTMSEHDTTNYHPRDYLFGIWKSDLVRNLLWHVTGGEDDIFNDVSFKTSRRLDESFAPSWSWASVTGAIAYYDEVNDENQRLTQLEPRISLLGDTCIPSTQNLYGPGTGELYVEGHLISVRVKTFVQGDRFVSRAFDSSSPSDVLGDAFLDIRDRFDNEVAHEEDLSWLVIAHLVALRRSNIFVQGVRPIGILLKAIPGRDNTYRRVGLVKRNLRTNLRTNRWGLAYSSPSRKKTIAEAWPMASIGQVRANNKGNRSHEADYSSDFDELWELVPTNLQQNGLSR